MITGLLVVGTAGGGVSAGPAAPVVVTVWQLVQRAEAFDFGVVCGDDPPVGRAGVLLSGDPAALEPAEQGSCWHPDLAGEGSQPPLAGCEAAAAGAVVVVEAGAQAQAADQVLDFAGVEAVVEAGGAEPLGREPAGDLGVGQAIPGQGGEPPGQFRVVRQLIDAGHGAGQCGVGLVAAGPVTVAWTRSVTPSAATCTDSMTARSSRLRSAMVVAGAAHSAGMSWARARMAASSVADSCTGRCRW